MRRWPTFFLAFIFIGRGITVDRNSLERYSSALEGFSRPAVATHIPLLWVRRSRYARRTGPQCCITLALHSPNGMDVQCTAQCHYCHCKYAWWLG